ncbi:MAG: response regulator transcription factor [Bacteroidota bacterium]
MTNILLVDDHQIVIDGIKTLLKGESIVNQIYVALNGKECLDIANKNDIDLMILDINLPDISGFEICKKIKAEKPNLKIIALTMHDNAGYISKMIKNGVNGYILKNTGKEELMRAINTVLAGSSYYSADVTQALVSGGPKSRKPKTTDFIQKLTRREKEVLGLIVEEMTTDEIAAQLFISATTVISHRKSLLRKLNAKNTAGLVKAAYEFGLLN